MAEQALRSATSPAGMPSAGAPLPAPTVQRKCSACEQKEDEIVHTKADGSGSVPSSADRAAAALSGGGAALEPRVRSRFETRFQRDFSAVRIYDSGRAADAAQAIHAHAFTVGENIGFARGAYAPFTRTGDRLLAHELAHVVQERRSGALTNVLSRQARPAAQQTFQDRSGGGTTTFQETVQNTPTRVGDVVSGSVDRSEIAPATAAQPQQTIHTGTVSVQFDARNCVMTLPYKFNFVSAPSAGPPICQDPPNTTAVPPVPPAQLQQIGRQYVAQVNEGLRGAFTVRMSGCQNGCADKDIEIRPDVTLDPSHPDATINVINRGGRGDAATLCAGDSRSGFAVHESGHQVLGANDEYRESDAGLRQRAPTFARDERVRSDLSRMGADADYGRFAEFHERHFRFAKVFLEAAFPGCTATLRAVPKTIPDFRLNVFLGVAGTNTGSALAVGGEFSVGLPLHRLRQLELRLGAQGLFLADMSFTARSALLLGARAGLEGRTSPANFGLTGGVFAGGGALHELSNDFTHLPSRTSGFVEGGATLGITSGLIGSGTAFNLQAEGAVGRSLSNDPDALRWYRIGVTLGVTF